MTNPVDRSREAFPVFTDIKSVEGKVIGSWWLNKDGGVECEYNKTGMSWSCESVPHAIDIVRMEHHY